MATTQRSVPAPSPAPARTASVRPTPLRPAPARATVAVGRAPQSVGPVTTRPDPVRPGARPARMDGVTAARPVRGGCSSEGGAEAAGAGAPRGSGRRPAPLRLTERGRRLVAGLSIAIGLSIAAATVVTVELGGADGGLELAGSSTVVVQPGDTLWSIARSVAPDEDSRVVIAAIIDLNGLDGADLLPGAELQLPRE